MSHPAAGADNSVISALKDALEKLPIEYKNISIYMNTDKRISFAQLLNLFGDVNLSEEGIEVVVCHLENEDNVSHQMNAIRTLKDAGKVILTIGLLPSFSESEEIIFASLERAQLLQRISDGCMLFNKDAFIDGGRNQEEVGTEIELVISEIEQGLQDILKDGTINIDAESVKEVLRDCGTFVVSRGVGTGINRVESAIRSAFAAPSYSKCDMNTAKALIIKVLVPKQDNLSVEETKQLQQLISNLSESMEVIFGIGSYEMEENQVEIVMLGTGLVPIRDI